MGKKTGFLEYERRGNPAIAPLERIQNFNEFHPPEEERRKQGARCMDCGVPFCQAGMNLCGAGFSGCPLHNLIPEWNDLIYAGNYSHALSRLLKTSNFPEFTSRVCPALCEAGCTCGLNGDPVTVKENEYFLIEYGYAHGLMQPRIPKVRTGKRVAVVGSGPSGLAVADQLNHRGHSVTVFERSDRIGGLLMYGIPNMKLEKKIVQRRVDLMTEEGVTFVTGADVGNSTSAQSLLDEFDAVVLCCGASNPRNLTGPGRDECQGIYFAVDFLKANTKSLLDSNLTDGKFISCKDKNVVIVGGGDTGNDCIGTASRQGAKSITQIEMLPKVPKEQIVYNPMVEKPKEQKFDSSQEECMTKFLKDPHIYQATVKAVDTDQEGNLTAVHVVHLEKGYDQNRRMTLTEIPGSEEILPCGLLVVAAGFIGPEEETAKRFGVATTPRSNIADTGYQTSVEKIFACGDCRTGQSLVVKAMVDGRECAKAVDRYLK